MPLLTSAPLVTSENDFQGPSWRLFALRKTASVGALVGGAVSLSVAERAGLGESGCCAWALMAPYPARNTPRNQRADWGTATPGWLLAIGYGLGATALSVS